MPGLPGAHSASRFANPCVIRLSGRPKSSPDGDLFYREALFACSPAVRRAAKSVWKALPSKAAEADIHAAGFGSKIRGQRPSDTSQGFFDRLKAFRNKALYVLSRKLYAIQKRKVAILSLFTAEEENSKTCAFRCQYAFLHKFLCISDAFSFLRYCILRLARI